MDRLTPGQLTLQHRTRCIQWNARGLSKANLEEFRQYITVVKPDIALLSETHWKPSFNAKFKSYHVLKKDRLNRPVVGVAVLVHKNLRFSPLILPNSDSMETISVTIMSSSNTPTDFISLYVPKGDCEVADIDFFFN
ncbi:Uncharacterized protein APZ42_013072 [Daphnia magna]|uniref:Endonuclease/exonuclease/phosphatase domain-containing protein n=1 Tax=Daphnia magna TaxID=35525 RepID=A0A162R6W3_9CRUS|nr:Uncharacterized protein APZ42_013072 [Daphnia magna]